MDSMWVSSLSENNSSTTFCLVDHPAMLTDILIERSISADCVSLSGSRIPQLLASLTAFVRHVREARSDIDALSRELHSLQTVLELLREDADLFPAELVERTAVVVKHCSSVVEKIDVSISALDDTGRSKQEKRGAWLDTGVEEMAGFRTALEAHRLALGLAVDLVGVYVYVSFTYLHTYILTAWRSCDIYYKAGPRPDR